jgi:hypothetical protein
MLDLFCGCGGWTNAFLERGWHVVGIDLVRSADYKGEFLEADVLDVQDGLLSGFDFVCDSSPCEEFSKWGLRCFFPDPPYPELGIELFNHTRSICEKSGLPYLMENVRAAQQYVGPATGHCGPFYLWGKGVPPIVPQGIIKGMTRKALGHYDYEGLPGWNTKVVALRLHALVSGFETEQTVQPA